MITTAVLVLQSWFDISILYTGSASNAFEIANANNRSVTDDLVIGELLTVPDELAQQKKILQYYSDRKLVPATGLTNENADLLNPNIGIGVMQIENSFIVS